VRSGLTYSPQADIHVITTASPGTWVSADHHCIAWCKQLVLAVNRALFDSIDDDANDISDASEVRKSAFHHHLVNGLGGKHFKIKQSSPPEDNTFDKDGFWSDSLKPQFVFERTKVSMDSHILIRIMDDEKHKDVVINAQNVDVDSWLFGCKVTTVHENIRLCESGDDLSHLAQPLPSLQDTRRKMVSANLHHLAKDEGYTHLLVYIPKGCQHVHVHIDVFNGEEQGRFIEVEAPYWMSFWKVYTLVEETHTEALFYNLSMKGLSQPWQAYDVKITSLNNCHDEEHYGIMRFVTPWANDAIHAFIGSVNITHTLIAHLQTPKQDSQDYFRSPEMQLFLPPTCQYKVQMQVNFTLMWGQIARFYGQLLLPMSLAVILLTMAQQLRTLAIDGECPSFLSVLTTVTPISVVISSKMIATLISSTPLDRYLPKTDYERLNEEVPTTFSYLRSTYRYIARP